MFYLALTGGLRVSELVTLRTADVRFYGKYVEIRVIGKGRKERALLLWKEVGAAIRAWLAIRGDAACPELFLSATAQPMTRSGFEYVLRKHIQQASVGCKSLVGKSVSPHTLRHTCAMDTLRATGDIRKVSLWLGHASQSTTEIYLQTDPTDKIRAIESTIPMGFPFGCLLFLVFAVIDTKDKISFTRDTDYFNHPGTPLELLTAFRTFYGPTMNAFEAAEKNSRTPDLAKELEALFTSQNKRPNNDGTSIAANFLRVTIAVRERDKNSRLQLSPIRAPRRVNS